MSLAVSALLTCFQIVITATWLIFNYGHFPHHCTQPYCHRAISPLQLEILYSSSEFTKGFHIQYFILYSQPTCKLDITYYPTLQMLKLRIKGLLSCAAEHKSKSFQVLHENTSPCICEHETMRLFSNKHSEMLF